VLRGKYNCQNISDNMETKALDSSLWKNIVKLSPNLNKYSFWAICNGSTVAAWTKACIDIDLRVIDLDVNIPVELMDAKVCDLVDNNGDWNWSIMRGWMSVELLHKIVVVLPPSDMNGESVMMKNWELVLVQILC
jgi:hypothetical protein